MTQIPIVDSHIHLFPESHLKTLSWHTPTNPLGTQHSINEYRHATQSPALLGFIFLETDRLSSINPTNQNHGWQHALDEVSLLTRIALGTPIPGEGHVPSDKNLCLGIVPWAPVPGGPDVLSAYMQQVRDRTGVVWGKVRGVRYLVQDKGAGTMLGDGFLEGLRWLGREGLVFDLGVDARSGGLGQLREAVEMMGLVEGVTIVINHLCKPNLRLEDDIRSQPEFLEWKDLVTKMATASPKTYMKLSGGFSELLPLEAESEPDFGAIVERVQPWTDVIFDAFGADRVMFGSDWPVCNVGGGGNDVAWGRWRRVVEEVLERRGLSEEEKKGVWGSVALHAYGIDI
ncbi:Amidohydrolase 2 [Penicillium concentricum]|uniref:Amidohydrolase 2 n=1 Tax=Penicillium concentricum TaxID=293559 RepID=A0A9W9RBJ7_9EURO|nr:Amidohydrolase 2 [Penicillium concentricum]KAJ5356520.1 Amidohydrolase 2 [Penicillium concentricum]